MNKGKLTIIENLKIDFWLCLFLSITMVFGLFILYSASNQNMSIVINQIVKIIIGFVVMLFFSQLNPQYLKVWTPRLFFISLFFLILVPLVGDKSLGAKRWLDLGIIRFQPSELIKFTLPMMIAYIVYKYGSLAGFRKIALSFIILLIPCFLILKQPDLGTAILIASSGLFVIFLSGISWGFIIKSAIAGLIAMPILWNILKDYQKQRILTLFNPEADPLGSGYHVIQSKIAIGSGGFNGSGWLEGSQTHLNFIPEQKTDFIFSVLGEEFGLIGFLLLMFFYFLIVSRCFYMFFNIKESYERLVSGALIMIFVCYIFVNIGMVSGILPVVGVPLPLISYGGTSIVSLLGSFGVISAFYHNQSLKKGKMIYK